MDEKLIFFQSHVVVDNPNVKAYSVCKFYERNFINFGFLESWQVGKFLHVTVICGILTSVIRIWSLE